MTGFMPLNALAQSPDAGKEAVDSCDEANDPRYGADS